MGSEMCIRDRQTTYLPKTEKINTDGQSTDSIPFLSLTPPPAEAAATPPERKRTGKDEAVRIYREIILENIEYDYLIQDSQIDREQLDEIVDLMQGWGREYELPGLQNQHDRVLWAGAAGK